MTPRHSDFDTESELVWITEDSLVVLTETFNEHISRQQALDELQAKADAEVNKEKRVALQKKLSSLQSRVNTDLKHFYSSWVILYNYRTRPEAFLSRRRQARPSQFGIEHKDVEITNIVERDIHFLYDEAGNPIYDEIETTDGIIRIHRSKVDTEEVTRTHRGKTAHVPENNFGISVRFWELHEMSEAIDLLNGALSVRDIDVIVSFYESMQLFRFTDQSSRSRELIKELREIVLPRQVTRATTTKSGRRIEYKFEVETESNPESSKEGSLPTGVTNKSTRRWYVLQRDKDGWVTKRWYSRPNDRTRRERTVEIPFGNLSSNEKYHEKNIEEKKKKQRRVKKLNASVNPRSPKTLRHIINMHNIAPELRGHKRIRGKKK